VIDEQLESAQVILLLVSAEFLASEYISDVELARALERHNAGEALVIPVILRPVDWKTAPFAQLQALPKDARPVTKWRNRDEAFANIAEGIRKAVSGFAAEISSPPEQVAVAADATTGPARWHESLSAGAVEVELDPSSRREMYTFRSVVSGVLREKGFRQTAVNRVENILGELLTNVAQHVPGSRAWVAAEAEEDWFPSVSITVYDSGPGINDGNIITNHERRLAQGEREHGLLRVARLADDLKLEPPRKSSADTRHGIWCDVFDPEPPPSVLFKYGIVAPVCVVYEPSCPVWLGREESYTGDYFIEALVRAVENDWRPLLDLYFGSLFSSGARYLGVEVTGDIYTSDNLPYTFPKLAAALEMYFEPYFKEKRVIVLIHHTDTQLIRMSKTG
jgi:anti-sigma regulatory factor (Ser/Thr protein kinase)